MQNHINNMMQCLLLASQGAGYVSPNPMVGAMLVHNGEMIGAGYHQQYGTEHAEVNCINSVQEKHKHLIAESTMYVSLEPCNHYGKTPPCTKLILDNGIKKVVIGCKDVSEKINGAGILELKNAGVEVLEKILEQQCITLNRRFFTFHQQKRPYIILKWAQTADGFIADENKKPLKISNPQTDKINHTWRSQEDAILVGYNTALIDNPRLNVRLIDGRNPVRIIIDKQNNLPKNLLIFDNTQATLIINDSIEKIDGNTVYKKLKSIQEIIFYLYDCKTLSVIIEGGAKTIQHFIDANLWDEARIIKSNESIGNGYTASILSNHQFLYNDEKENNVIEYYKNISNIYL